MQKSPVEIGLQMSHVTYHVQNDSCHKNDSRIKCNNLTRMHTQESILPNVATNHLQSCVRKHAHGRSKLKALLVYSQKLHQRTITNDKTKRGFKRTIALIKRQIATSATASRAVASAAGDDHGASGGKSCTAASNRIQKYDFKCPGCNTVCFLDNLCFYEICSRLT